MPLTGSLLLAIISQNICIFIGECPLKQEKQGGAQ